MLIILNQLDWFCDRCDDCRSQQTVSVIFADGSEGYLCRRHLNESIREQCRQKEEEVAR